MKYKRIFVIVLDSLGIGAMADAKLYNDENTNTYKHIYEYNHGINAPTLQSMGMENLVSISNIQPLGYTAVLNEASVGKDTMTGHLEMMGLHTTSPFKTFTKFPDELIHELEVRCNRKVIGNKPSSGTEILDELAMEEIKHGHMIVYTSADSVLQICGHEEYMGLDSLYEYCKIARELTLKEEWKIGRVIARPYIGNKVGEFKRTSNRHDYALKPANKTVLDALKENNLDVIGVGKIADIFDHEGITSKYVSKSSVHGMEQTIEIMDEDFTGLCFVNLVDFDALWGHRRNPVGYKEEIERFDPLLKDVISKLKEDDLLMVTADHGNDPTHIGTDHTREQVPLLIYSPSMKECNHLGTMDTFAVIGMSILDNFHIQPYEHLIGHSILDKLK